MKLDLHLHTLGSISNGDSIKWDSTLDSIRKLFNKKISSFAFTDHNFFDLNLYLEAKEIIKNNMIIFPGVEINILKKDGSIAHLLIIFENNLGLDKLKELSTIIKEKLRKKGIRIESVYKIFSSYKKILIPHVGKGDNFKPKELSGFDHDAIEITSYEHPNYKRWLKVCNNKSVVAFSDTHIWRDYPQNKTLFTKINFNGSFDGLKKELSKNKNFTKRSLYD